MHKEPPEFAELLAQRPPAVANLARRLRLAALKAIPDLTERFYPGWEGLGLRHPKAGLLGTVSRARPRSWCTSSVARRCPIRTAYSAATGGCARPAR
jgi:hypothetical protein